ncbi:hypothetical protein [Calothrix sp. NIES-2100]|uniref:hypothetical protein n=1 Tax=Calothrix sp. NIES-2100 TaxID=1954172 RepID=UPI0030DB1337
MMHRAFVNSVLYSLCCFWVVTRENFNKLAIAGNKSEVLQANTQTPMQLWRCVRRRRWRSHRLKAVDSNNAPKSTKVRKRSPLISYFCCHSFRRTNSFKSFGWASLLRGNNYLDISKNYQSFAVTSL